jgi:hypothetical protein
MIQLTAGCALHKCQHLCTVADADDMIVTADTLSEEVLGVQVINIMNTIDWGGYLLGLACALVHMFSVPTFFYVGLTS